jgi:hypothetical protein
LKVEAFAFQSNGYEPIKFCLKKSEVLLILRTSVFIGDKGDNVILSVDSNYVVTVLFFDGEEEESIVTGVLTFLEVPFVDKDRLANGELESLLHTDKLVCPFGVFPDEVGLVVTHCDILLKVKDICSVIGHIDDRAKITPILKVDSPMSNSGINTCKVKREGIKIMANVTKPVLCRVFSCNFILLELGIDQRFCTSSHEVIGLIRQWIEVGEHPCSEIIWDSDPKYLLNFKSFIVQNQHIMVLSVNDVSVMQVS